MVRTAPDFLVSLHFAGFPCWQGFLAVYTIAELSDGADHEKLHNLSEGLLCRNHPTAGCNAEGETPNTYPAGFYLHWASDSSVG